MKEFLLLLMYAYSLIWLAKSGPKKTNLSSNTSNKENEFTPYKGGRKWTAEDTPEKVAVYEETHYSDFLKNKEKYEVWPELRNEIPAMFCRKYVRKLFPFSISRLQIIPEKWSSISLHYTATNNEISDLREPVKVTAAQCFIPNSSKCRYLLYIRASQPHCAFLVKPLKRNAKPRFENDFHIINEFCVDTDPNINKDFEVTQEQNFYNRSERGKWIVRRQKKKTKRVPKKEKSVEEVPPETLAKYEKEHADNYLMDKDQYETWPELKIMDEKLVCEKSLQNFFTHSIFKNVYPTVLWSMKLQYVNLVVEHNEDLPRTVSVPILQCYVPYSSKRRYHYYIRAPRPHCLYVVRPLTNWKCAEFKIINEFCEELELSHENSNLALLAEDSISNKPTCKKRRYQECPFEDLQKYEKAHFKDYNDDKDIYEKWLELNTLNKEMLCKKSIEPLFPSILHQNVDVSFITSAKLHYQNVMDSDGMPVMPNEVAVLQCYWKTAYRNKYFQFIKSTVAFCVFLVKNLAQNLQHTDFRIVNQICLDPDEYQKLILNY